MRNVGRISVLMFAFVVLIGYAAMASAEEKCPLCGMSIAGNENTAYEITFADGKVVTYCCAHCGLIAQAEAMDKVKSARSRDFISGEWKDVKEMTFLSGSTAVPACAPSWIAFGPKADAEKFKKGFGGKIFGFEQALKERKKQPREMKMEHKMEHKH